MKTFRHSVLVFLFVIAGFQVKSEETKNVNSISIHTELGIPKDADTSDDYLIIRPQYALSYNKNLNVANWVSWNLNNAWYGDVPRFSGNFIVDTSLPAGFIRAKHTDYSNSGFDRGHMVRSEERTATAEDNKSTFIITNILPQTPTLNQQTWLSLEYECERLCKTENKELYVIAGGHFPTNPQKLNGVVSVPDSCWKIVVIMDRGQKLEAVNASTKIIAVMMNNGVYNSSNNNWKYYTTTVRAIEESTGYDFLSDVPKNIQNIIENKNFTSIEETGQVAEQLSVNPNPASSRLQFSYPADYIGELSLSIIDGKGSVIMSWKEQANVNHASEVSLIGLQSGQYTLTINAQKQSLSKSFVILQ